MKTLISIPSKGRAGNVTTSQYIDGAVIFCPKAEQKAYEKHHAKVVGVPASIKGITATRNFILDYARKKKIRNVVQVDDDAGGFYIMEGLEYIKVEKDRLHVVIDNYFEIIRAMGTCLFGFSVALDRKFYREYSPFSLTSVVVGNFMGIIENGMRFDEDLVTREDYDFSLQVLRKFRRVFRSNKHCMKVEHWQNPGGCVSYRTQARERASIKRLREKWGPQIVGRHPRKELEITVRSPIRGI